MPVAPEGAQAEKKVVQGGDQEKQPAPAGQRPPVHPDGERGGLLAGPQGRGAHGAHQGQGDPGHTGQAAVVQVLPVEADPAADQAHPAEQAALRPVARNRQVQHRPLQPDHAAHAGAQPVRQPPQGPDLVTGMADIAGDHVGGARGERDQVRARTAGRPGVERGERRLDRAVAAAHRHHPQVAGGKGGQGRGHLGRGTHLAQYHLGQTGDRTGQKGRITPVGAAQRVVEQADLRRPLADKGDRGHGTGGAVQRPAKMRAARVPA